MSEALPSAARAEHLTQALHRSGVLGDGHVAEVSVESARNTILSRIFRLRLRYEGNASSAPATLILKTENPNRVSSGWNAGEQEVAFYTQVAAATPTGLVPRCFDAVWDDSAKTSHLLLEDLTDTHATATTWPLPPTYEQCRTIMRTRARFQAAWWDDARLGVTTGKWSGDPELEQYLTRLSGKLDDFSKRYSEHMPRERRALYDRLLAAGLRLADRYRSRRNMTVVHGDAHFWNCFLPKDGGEDVRLFDWDSWRVDVAADDLSYAMAVHWYPDRRARYERLLLDDYHDELLARGVHGYDRQALADDYRLSALWQIATPIWQASNNVPPVIWWNNLERILLAVDDLGCRDLLD